MKKLLRNVIIKIMIIIRLWTVVMFDVSKSGITSIPELTMFGQALGSLATVFLPLLTSHFFSPVFSSPRASHFFSLFSLILIPENLNQALAEQPFFFHTCFSLFSHWAASLPFILAPLFPFHQRHNFSYSYRKRIPLCPVITDLIR